MGWPAITSLDLPSGGPSPPLAADGWTVQPNFQYIIHPGGGAPLPSGPQTGKSLENASVFGLRTTLKF
jgi:carbohydrate-selective porin OprB